LVAREVEHALTEHLHRTITIDTIEQRSEGWSQFTFIASGTANGAPSEFVIRVDPGRNMWKDEASLERQYRVLRAIAGQGIPAPIPIAYIQRIERIEGPVLVMERLPGEPIVPWSRHGRAVLAAARSVGLHDDFMRILAAVHGSRWQADERDWIAGGSEPYEPYGVKELVRWQGILSGALWRPDPIAELVIIWLRDNLPPQSRWGLVHGDYRTGNLLFKDNGIVGVLDWESADWGDPIADLGYLCAPPHVIDGLACGLASNEAMVASYEKHAGVAVDARTLDFYRLMATLKNHAIWVLAGAQALQGETSDLRSARGVLAAQNVRSMLLGLLPGAYASAADADHPVIESLETLSRLSELAAQKAPAGTPGGTFGAGQERASEALRMGVERANPPAVIERYRRSLARSVGANPGDQDVEAIEELAVARIRSLQQPGATKEPWFAQVAAALSVQFEGG
jgi:aminoglycoside phosphotransferase (APT) family kinase protein